MNRTVYKGLQIVSVMAILVLNLGLNGIQTVYAAAPSHDNFANARLIDNITYYDLNVDTTEATQQNGGTPNSADPDNVLCQYYPGTRYLDRGDKTVWYKYRNTSASNESIAIDTKDTNDYDTYIAIWTGTQDNLTLVGCSDEDYYGDAAYSFTAQPNIWYYIEVAQYVGIYDSTPPETGTGGLLQFHAYITNLDVFIGAGKQDSYYLDAAEILFDSYPSKLDGPVKVVSTNNENIFTTQVVVSGGSYNELAGYPANQFSTEYWFPYYDHGYPSVANNKMRTWILVGNPDDTLTAEVEIRIGGVLQTVPGSNPPTTTFSILPGGNVTPRWPGTVRGPVQVKATNGVDIFASERVFTVPFNSFNEVVGLPVNQFTTEYWFPWYDTKYMDTYIVVGNTSTTQAANVDIYIGPTKYSYSIAKNTSIKQRYPNQAIGPVRVVSTNGVNIVTSEYTLSGTQFSFNEVMGYPFDQFDTEFWYPYYDHGYPSVPNDNMRTWILVGNPSTSQTATVEIYVNGVAQVDPNNTSNYFFSIPPGANVTPRWMGTVAGPVRVVSDIPVFTSERVFTIPNNAFNEFMGIPFSQFTTEYWFTWYDSVNMSNQVRVSNSQ